MYLLDGGEPRTKKEKEKQYCDSRPMPQETNFVIADLK